MKNILIIGCGLLGSSVLRSIHKKKLASKIFVYEKSKKNISTLKHLKLPGKVVSSLKSHKKRDLNSILVRRRGRIYIINKKNPKYKVRQK